MHLTKYCTFDFDNYDTFPNLSNSHMKFFCAEGFFEWIAFYKIRSRLMA
jgi:hypothetical protein